MRFLFFILFISITFIGVSQEKTISGVVFDENNLPLPGATIIIKGTNNGVSADFDGLYNIKVTKGSILEFSYVGYKNQVFEVTELNTIDVAMELDDSFINMYQYCFPAYSKIDNKTHSSTTLRWNGMSFYVER